MRERPIQVFHNAKVVGSGCDPDAYHKEGQRGTLGYVMTRGQLLEFDRCPSRWRRGYRQKETDAKNWGSLMDCLLLDARRFKERFAVKPATYTNSEGQEKPWNANSNTCRAWLEEHHGLSIVTPLDLVNARAALDRIRSQPELDAILQSAKFQVCVTADYHDAETGLEIPVKILVDIVPGEPFDESLIDFKTARTASLFTWAKHCHEYGLDVQAAFYLDVWNASHSATEQRLDFRQIIQESYEPYELGARILSAEFVELGRSKYRKALARYCQCLKDNKWPSYDGHEKAYQGWSIVDPAPWMLAA